MGLAEDARADAERLDIGPFAQLVWPLGVPAGSRYSPGRRAVLLAIVAWLPLAILVATRAPAWTVEPRDAFLRDISAHVRYLVTLPLLVIAQAVAFPRMAAIARQFGEAGLIPDHERERYAEALGRTGRRADSHLSGFAILLTAFAISLPSVWAARDLGPRPTWTASLVDGLPSFSGAGLWRVLVSQPLLLLVAIGWIWRMALWTVFLWRISRLELRLVPAHPDLAGGLSFVTTSLPPLSIASFALGAWAAGAAAEELLDASWTMRQVGIAAVVLVVLVLLLFTGPVLSLARPMARARLRGLLAYDSLASSVGHRFETRFLRPLAGSEATADPLTFSDTTDLYQVVGNVHQMRLVPLELRALVPLVVAALLPMVPAVLIAMPVEQALQLVRQLLL